MHNIHNDHSFQVGKHSYYVLSILSPSSIRHLVYQQLPLLSRIVRRPKTVINLELPWLDKHGFRGSKVLFVIIFGDLDLEEMLASNR